MRLPLNLSVSELALFAGAGDSAVTHGSTEINLFTSDRDGVVGLVDGDNWRWARTAMELAGFHKTEDGNYAVPLADLDRAREVLLTLGAVARLAGVKVAPSSERYIGDFARDLIERLPGKWTVRVENYALKLWQEDLASCLWSTGPVADTLDQHRMPWAAILQRDDGVELTVLNAPDHDLYHVGALTCRDVYPDELVTPPPGVTVHPTPDGAATVIRTHLLPDFARAVLHCQVNSLEEDLSWIREEFEAGTVPEPPPTHLVDAFTRFTTTAPHIVSAVRALGTLNEHGAAFLQKVDDIVGTSTASPEATSALPYADPLAWWLAEGGEGLFALARRAVPDSEPPAAEASRALASPRALPPPPTQAASRPRR